MEGEANLLLIKFMGEILGLKKSQVSLETGHKARNKVRSEFYNPFTILIIFSSQVVCASSWMKNLLKPSSGQPLDNTEVIAPPSFYSLDQIRF